MTTTNTDRIEKQVVLSAPRSRVRRAITDAEEFGEWFGVKFDAAFAADAAIVGKIRYPGYEHLSVEVLVEKIEPERHFSFQWHPYDGGTDVNFLSEPKRLVEFFLDEAEYGVSLAIVETGFDQLPLDRRAEAFRRNEGGWDGQVKNIERYLS